MLQLIPEWHPQWGVMIAWPHRATDWAPLLREAETTYTSLARAILAREHLLILCRDREHEAHIRACLNPTAPQQQRLHFCHLPYNDTWTRDYGPLARAGNDGLELLDFRFNGWGDKHPAELDNAVNGQVQWAVPLHRQSMVLEGGSVDSNGRGILLTTSACLLNPNRNPQMDRARIQYSLEQALGATEILWLDHGFLEGDDTDAHIDTLARFCNDSTIAYVKCTDRADAHFPALARMEEQLQQKAARHNLQTVPLPMPPACYSETGERLPATYANFLIINDAVLMPVYGVATDDRALETLAGLFPDRAVEAVDCRALIEQHGSLHCVTMQLPEGVI